jgi:hypothetical protein
VDSQQQSVRGLHGFGRRSRASIPAGVAREAFQLLLVACIAEDDLMSRSREDRTELSAHQA